jgi:protein-S-isoprenylcysteine O-methyltransferase Ste14
VSPVRLLARVRVPLGFVCAAVAYWLARPSPASILLGLFIAVPGEVLRVWASGHIDKGREVTQSGPYRLTRHPLYLGSTIMGIGFVAAARSWIVALVVLTYLALTLGAAMRVEEATLDARFGGEYAAYREGRAPAPDRRFSAARMRANREHRAVFGLVAGFALLVARWYLIPS